MSFFVCPVCREALSLENGTYRCENRHCYDRASSGYVNLLPANRMHSKQPGDDRDMAVARKLFLSAGYYAPLRSLLGELCVKYAPENVRLLDSGCGEGYYTAGIRKALEQAGKAPVVGGVDISKKCLTLAAKRDGQTEFAVASAYALPVADRSADLLLDCFAPLSVEEFGRVLKPGGVFLYVVPGAEHLWEMKQVLYEAPYRNKEQKTPYEGFDYLEIVPIRFSMALESAAHIQALFGMTPYFWRTPKAGRERLCALETLSVTAAFDIHVYRRA